MSAKDYDPRMVDFYDEDIPPAGQTMIITVL